MSVNDPGAVSAIAELRRLLEPFGMAELAEIAYQLQLQGITDPEQLILELEQTEAFRARFPGYRDPDTGEANLSLPAYIEYENTLQERMAAFSFDPEDYGVPFRVFAASLIQNNRSLSEVQQDFEAYNELANDPFLRQEFYLYAGVDPGPDGLFALMLGIAPDLEQQYNAAIEAGTSLSEFQTRLNAWYASHPPVPIGGTPTAPTAPGTPAPGTSMIPGGYQQYAGGAGDVWTRQGIMDYLNRLGIDPGQLPADGLRSILEANPLLYSQLATQVSPYARGGTPLTPTTSPTYARDSDSPTGVAPGVGTTPAPGTSPTPTPIPTEQPLPSIDDIIDFLQTSGPAFVSAGPTLMRSTRLLALRRAQLAAQARFKAGGESVTQKKVRERTF